jgi:hypothetical protein
VFSVRQKETFCLQAEQISALRVYNDSQLLNQPCCCPIQIHCSRDKYWNLVWEHKCSGSPHVPQNLNIWKSQLFPQWTCVFGTTATLNSSQLFGTTAPLNSSQLFGLCDNDLACRYDYTPQCSSDNLAVLFTRRGKQFYCYDVIET